MWPAVLTHSGQWFAADDHVLLPGADEGELRLAEQSGRTRWMSKSSVLLALATVGVATTVAGVGVISRTQRIHTSSHVADAIKMAEDKMTKAQKMVAKYSALIDDLNVEVLQCDEQVEKLTSLKPYVVNAMVSVLGQRAKGCDLAEYSVHYVPPSSPVPTCAVHCGEDDCPVSLNFLRNHKEAFRANCDRILYMQGGAACWVERNVKLKNRAQCASITQGKSLGQYKKLAGKIGIQDIECGSTGWTDKLAQANVTYVLNAMIGAFGKVGDSCSPGTGVLSGVPASASAPSERQDSCLIYCGESFCPYAQDFLQEQSPTLSKFCASIYLLRGGAKCLLNHGLSVRDKEACSQLVFGEGS